MRPTRTQAKTSKCKQTPVKTSQDQSRQLKICQDKLSNIKHQQLSHPKGFQTGFIFMYDKPLTHTPSEPHIGVLRFCIWHSWSLLQRQPNINNVLKILVHIQHTFWILWQTYSTYAIITYWFVGILHQTFVISMAAWNKYFITISFRYFQYNFTTRYIMLKVFQTNLTTKP